MNYLTASVYLAMASRKRRHIEYEEHSSEPRAVAAPNICTLPIEGINPTLDPNRALLRRVFFLNDDHSKYCSVAFYPAQGYAALVEFGTTKNAPVSSKKSVHRSKLTSLITTHCITTLWNMLEHIHSSWSCATASCCISKNQTHATCRAGQTAYPSHTYLHV